LFDDKTSGQAVNVQRDETPKRYIPLTAYDGDDGRRDDADTWTGDRRAPMETRIVPAMTDDSPTVEEDLDLSKEDIR